MKIRNALLILSAVFSTVAHSAGPSAIDTISVLSAKGDGSGLGDGEAYIHATAGSWSLGNPDNCPTAYPYTYSMTSEAGKALNSLALDAYREGRRVRVYINGCLSNKPRVVRIDVIPWAVPVRKYFRSKSVSRVRANQDGTVEFGVVGEAPEICNYYGYQFRFQGTTDAGRAMLSVLLSAKASKQQVDLWYAASTKPGTDNTSGCMQADMAAIGNIALTGE